MQSKEEIEKSFLSALPLLESDKQEYCRPSAGSVQFSNLKQRIADNSNN